MGSLSGLSPLHLHLLNTIIWVQVMRYLQSLSSIHTMIALFSSRGLQVVVADKPISFTASRLRGPIDAYWRQKSTQIDCKTRHQDIWIVLLKTDIYIYWWKTDIYAVTVLIYPTDIITDHHTVIMQPYEYSQHSMFHGLNWKRSKCEGGAWVVSARVVRGRVRGWWVGGEWVGGAW